MCVCVCVGVRAPAHLHGPFPVACCSSRGPWESKAVGLEKNVGVSHHSLRLCDLVCIVSVGSLKFLGT